jgi:hypothetical protein
MGSVWEKRPGPRDAANPVGLLSKVCSAISGLRPECHSLETGQILRLPVCANCLRYLWAIKIPLGERDANSDRRATPDHIEGDSVSGVEECHVLNDNWAVQILGCGSP